MQTVNQDLTAQRAEILVVDSGLGGLSICRQIVAQQRNIKINYCSDNAAFPYGNKSPELITCRLLEIIGGFLDHIRLDAVVVACNTASTVALDTLRKNYKLPFVGVVPAIKTASKQCRSGTFALLATPGTVENHYTNQLIDEFACDKHVIKVGSSDLVISAERYLLSGYIDNQAVSKALLPLLSHPQACAIDTVVLGCTHFPLIQESLQKTMPNWQLVESGPAIAKRLNTVLSETVFSKTATCKKPEPAKQANLAFEHQFYASSRDVKPSYFESLYFLRYIEKLGFSPKLKCLADMSR